MKAVLNKLKMGCPIDPDKSAYLVSQGFKSL